MSETRPEIGSVDAIERRIYLIRGQKVILDSDLALLYQVPTKAFNQAVQRNLERFPADFMFRLSVQELENWRSQILACNAAATSRAMRSQIVTASKRNIRHPPYVFTEHGVPEPKRRGIGFTANFDAKD